MADYATINDWVAAQGAPSPTSIDVVPTVVVAYSVVGGALVGASGIFDGWKVVNDAKLTSITDSNTAGYCEFIQNTVAETTLSSPAGIADNPWVYLNVKGDFDFAIKISSDTSGGALKACCVRAGAPGDVSANDFNHAVDLMFGRQSASVGGYKSDGTACGTEKPRLSFSGGHSWTTTRWIRIAREGRKIRVYNRVADGDAWTELNTAGGEEIDLAGYYCRLGIAMTGNGGADKIRVHRIVATYSLQ